MEELLDARRARGRALVELEAWSAQAAASLSRRQAAAVAALSDEDVTRLIHESR
jgi:hypothetical protein